MTTMHPHDDLLEAYAMEKLAEDEAAALEEHLLACSGCRDRLVEVEDFIATFRQAVQESQQVARKVLPFRMPRRIVWAPLAAAAALILGIFAYQSQEHQAMTPAVLFLQPLRGPESGTETTAARPLILVMDVQAEAAGGYAAEIVDSEGERVLWAQPELRDGRLSMRSPGLEPGAYWVRLYERRPALEQIHEYRVRVH
jgi:hypothetical protein